MSFFEELKRRNVFKVGIAYAVATWVLIQIADILLDNFGAPPWVMKSLVLILAIGFFITLFFAWAYEMTPEGVKRESEVDRSQSIAKQTGQKLNYAIIGLLVVALGYFVWESRFSSGSSSERGSEPFSQESPVQISKAGDKKRDPTPGGAEPAQAISRQSIAVLPFDNRSPDPNDAYFAEGIHDDLLTNLSRIGSLKVISRTSVTQYKGTEKTIPQIAAELGVATVMEGAVQRSGDQVRINVQLIDAQTDEHLWAEIFDRELTAKNLFAIQSEISGAIAGALKATLTSDEQQQVNTVPTQNLLAYEAYMRGRQLMATRETAKLEEATREFREAVDLDPQFALAWVGIADSFDLLANYGSLNKNEAEAIRRDAVSHALEIAPRLGEAYVSLASILGDRGEYADMESAFRKAIELNPNYATAYHWFGGNLKGLSRVQEAVDLMRKAAELDPRSAIIGSNLADSFADQGLYSRAEQQARKVIEQNPGFAQGYSALGVFYAYALGRFDLAIQNTRTALTVDPVSPLSLLRLTMYSLEIGDRQAADQYRQMIADINDQDWRVGWTAMLISAADGNTGAMREAWNWTSSRIPGYPVFPNYADFPGYAALLELTQGDPAAARKIYLVTEPGWMTPEAWKLLVDHDPAVACLVAWTMEQTGDEALGAALLKQTLAYLDALPGLVEHADLWNPQLCYLAAGDKEKALATIETQLAHNHLARWKTFDQLPMYEQIRFEPRYQAAMAEHDRRIAEQRKTIEQMTAENGL